MLSHIWSSRQSDSWSFAQIFLSIRSSDPEADERNFLILPEELERLWDAGVFALLPKRRVDGELEFRAGPAAWQINTRGFTGRTSAEFR